MPFFVYQANQYSGQISKFEVEGESEKFWRVRMRDGSFSRSAKKYDHFKSFDEAKTALIARLQRNVDHYKVMVEDNEQKLAKARTLKEAV